MGLLDWLRGRRYVAPDIKQSAVAAIIATGIAGRPVWPGRDYEKGAREGYQQNPVVYACVRMIADAAAGLSVLARVGEDEREDSKTLALLRRPNPVTPTLAGFVSAWMGFRLVAGNVFVERVDGLGGVPRELYFWRPDRAFVVPGEDGWIEAYEYRWAGRIKRIPVRPEVGQVAILHVKSWNPIDDWYGMPNIDPAAYAIDTHTGASAWNKSLLENSARPAGAFVAPADKDGIGLSDEQMRHVSALIEKMKPGKPLILNHGLDWREMSYDAVEMDFVAGKSDAARDIARAFGVPPMLLGIPGDNTYSNYQEAREALFEMTVGPLVQEMLQSLAAWLAPSFGEDGLILELDEDEIPSLARKRAEKWTAVQNADWLTVNEKRAATGYDDLEGDAGDAVMVAASMVPLEQAIEPPDEHDGAAPGEDDPDMPDKRKPVDDADADKAALAMARDVLAREVKLAEADAAIAEEAVRRERKAAEAEALRGAVIAAVTAAVDRIPAPIVTMAAPVVNVPARGPMRVTVTKQGPDGEILEWQEAPIDG